jgi:hypothetical protein
MMLADVANTSIGTVAGTITAVTGIVTALALLIGAIPLLVKTLADLRKAKEAVDAVHIIVNQAKTNSEQYQTALINALLRAGVAVPDDQSKQPPPS